MTGLLFLVIIAGGLWLLCKNPALFCLALALGLFLTAESVIVFGLSFAFVGAAIFIAVIDMNKGRPDQ